MKWIAHYEIYHAAVCFFFHAPNEEFFDVYDKVVYVISVLCCAVNVFVFYSEGEGNQQFQAVEVNW